MPTPGVIRNCEAGQGKSAPTIPWTLGLGSGLWVICVLKFDVGRRTLNFGHASRASRDFSRLRIHADDFPFLDKKRHAHHEARFNCGLLARATGRGVPARA